MTTLESQSPSRDVPLLNLPAALCSLLAATPFLLFPLIHFLRWGDAATGFTTYDLPYYAANARAILDRGHAGLYPNPFDPDPAAPVIYFHWLMDLLAGLVGPLGLSPGPALLLIQIIGALASARIMFSLVTWLLPASRWRTLLYFLTMWSGGLLVLGKLLANLASGLAWNADLLALDPGQGLWCLNFGRNLILPTEAVYHALMLPLWLSLLKGQWTRAAMFLLAIVTTHPFTGAQALAIAGVHAFACQLLPAPTSPRRRTREGEAPAEPQALPAPPSAPRPPRSFFISFALIAAAFVAYYFLFLPRFPQHREIQQTWTLGWTLSGPTILLAYTPAALLAWLAIRDDSAWRRQSRFLLIAAGVSFLLANHQWFITPRQPIHFTRGYIWTPLFLAGLPTLAVLFDKLFPIHNLQFAICNLRFASRLPRLLALLAIAALATSDNAAFLLINATTTSPPGFGLTQDERAAFAHLNSNHLTGILLTDDDRLGYLAAALTSTRPWLGHKYNTPNFDDRQTKLAAFKSTTAAGDLLDEVNLALTADPRVIRRLQDNNWQKLATHGDLQLWQKP